MEPRISLITLGVDDLVRSRRFYEEGLGWPVSAASVAGEVVFLRLTGIVLALYRADALAKDLRRSLEPRGSARFTLAHNARSREEVDAIFGRAARAGAALLQPPQPTSWGGYSGHFADPEGHVWEIAWNPHFPFAADGSLVIPA